MVAFVDALKQGRFVITTEEPPPRGTDIAPFLRRTARLAGLVDGINLTEGSGGLMTMSPLGLVPHLIAQGHTPIPQITCRDRNRIAIQAEVLAAAALGATVIVGMTGDPIGAGDDAIAVHDLDTPGLLRAISRLNEGRDLAGNALNRATNLWPGAVVNPNAQDLDSEVAWMEQKVEAGARFFQTQAIYDPESFESFLVRVERLRVPVCATYVVPKSAEMARQMNASIPGIRVPESMVRALEASDDAAACAVELSAPILSRLAAAGRGLHLIAVGWESRFGDFLDAAGLHRSAE